MFYIIEHRVAKHLNMTPVAVMGSKKLPPAPLPHFDNNNITNEAENLKETNPSFSNGENLSSSKDVSKNPEGPSKENNLEENSSSQITTTNLTPEDITDQLDDLIESSPKRIKSE